MKKPFEVNDRVRVYGHRGNEWRPFVGSITSVKSGDEDGLSLAVLKDGKAQPFLCHPKQCRRLKPKPRPEKKGARKVWIAETDLKAATGHCVHPNEDTFPAQFSLGKIVEDDIEFREVLPGEVVVTRDSFRASWIRFCTENNLSTYDLLCMENVAKALGLPEREGS